MLSINYLLLFLTIICVEITRKKSNLLDFLTYFHLNFVLFCVFPGFTLSKITGTLHGDSLTLQSNIQILIAVYLGYFLVLLGFYSKSAIKVAKKITIKQYSDHTILKISNYLLIFVGISVVIYSAQYGGFINAISQSAAIRSGKVESGSLVLFKTLFDGAEYSSYFLASLAFFSIKSKKNVILYLKLGLSIILSLMTMLMKSSRASIVRYFIGFALAYIIYKKKIPWVSMTIFIVIAMAVVLYGDPLFASLSSIPNGYDSFVADFSQRLAVETNHNAGDSFEYELVEKFDHPIQSLDTAFNNEYQFRWFSDFIFGFTSLLPSRLIPIKTPKNISYLNTFLSLGHNDWTRPPGFLALGIYSMSWMGLVIICFCYGWLGCCLQTILSKDENNQPWISFLYVIIMNIWSHLITTGDPALVIRGNVVFLLSIFFIFSFSRKNHRMNDI